MRLSWVQCATALLSLTMLACGAGNKSACETDFYLDEDGDGLGDPAKPVAGENPCSPPWSAVSNADDAEPSCVTNDTDSCGICGGAGPQAYYADADKDGLADLPTVEVAACEIAPGLADKPRELAKGCVLTADQAGCVESPTCDADCSAPTCGDGVVSSYAGEECDTADGPDGNCHRCKLVEGFRLSFPGAGGPDFGGLCITQSHEIYVAAEEVLYKVSADGTLEWQLAFGFGTKTAGIGCDATYGVVAVRSDESIQIQRWLPNGSAAYGPVLVADGSATNVVLRSDGTTVLVRRLPCAELTCTSLHAVNADGTMSDVGPSAWPAPGRVMALASDDVSSTRLLLDTGYNTIRWYSSNLLVSTNPPYTEIDFQGSDSLVAGFAKGGMMVFASRKSGDRRWAEGFSFGSGGSKFWDPPVALRRGAQETVRSFTPWRDDGTLVASYVDGQLLLTTVDSSGRISKVLTTGFREASNDLVAIGQLQQGNVVWVESQQDLVIRLIAFEERGLSMGLTVDGGSCAAARDCQSGFCGATSLCESTTAMVGNACNTDDNCQSGLCLSKVCAASELPAGEPCMSARQCASKLCTPAGCG